MVSKKKVMLVCSIFLSCVVMGLILLLWFQYRVHHVPSDEIRERDVATLREGDYEVALLSMYTPESFDADEIAFFLGISTVQAFHSFVNLADIGDYLEQSFTVDNNLSYVYIGLDPFEVSKLYGYHTSLYTRDYEKYLTEYVRTHEDVVFKFLIPAYSMEYMRSLSDNEYTELLNAYRNLVNIYIPYDNAAIFFLGHEEWLIVNPDNYVTPTDCEPSILRTAVAYTFRDDKYSLTPDNMEQRFACMTKLVHDSSVIYPDPDLSEWCIVFFGDSIFEYHAGSRSVPGVVGGLSGAQVYNCSESGTAAAKMPDASLSFNHVITRFLTQDTSELDEDANFVLGLTDYAREDHQGKRYCFVLNYGVNDYYSGHPIENPVDGFDVSTYAGALRTGISALQESYPEAEIILLTPIYTTYFSEGTEEKSERGGVLVDYVDAAIKVARDMNVICINNYAESGINADTQGEYLTDGCHPNETGALLLGRRILDEMRRMIEDGE